MPVNFKENDAIAAARAFGLVFRDELRTRYRVTAFRVPTEDDVWVNNVGEVRGLGSTGPSRDIAAGRRLILRHKSAFAGGQHA